MTNQELIQYLKEAANILKEYEPIEPDKEIIMDDFSCFAEVYHCGKCGTDVIKEREVEMEMERKTFIKVTSQMDKHIMYINKTYIMMLEKLANGSRIWVSGGDHGNVRIVNESVEELLEQMAVE